MIPGLQSINYEAGDDNLQMNKKYRIVLIGCGQMGAAHLNEIYCKDEIEISGVVDLDPERARGFGKKYGALSWDTDYKKYLEDKNTDIFIIATYPSSHLEILGNCLAHSKNVLCEKPIATNIHDAREFVRLVKQSDAKVLIGHILRHNKTYKKAAELIQEGSVGSPVVMRMVQNHHTKDWERYRKLILQSSPIIDCGVHYIDIMHWFTGSRVTSVSGISARTEPDLPEDCYNYGMICLTFEDGSVAYYEAGWGNTVASGNIKEILGPEGRIRIVYRNARESHQEEGDLIEYYNRRNEEYRIINVDSNRKPTWEQLCHLIDMIEGDVPAVPSIDEVFEAFESVVAADEAISKRVLIDMKEFRRQ